MHLYHGLFALFALTCFTGCQAEKEEIEGSEYDNMVMNDEEEPEWTTGENKGNIAGELIPDPQEILIAEPLQAVLR